MQKYLPVLRNCPFFTGLTDDEILSILHCVSAAKITRPRGSYIFRAGDSTEVMGLMLSGSTLVIQEDLWGHRNILSKCNTGDFFGEPYAATPGAILNIKTKRFSLLYSDSFIIGHRTMQCRTITL